MRKTKYANFTASFETRFNDIVDGRMGKSGSGGK